MHKSIAHSALARAPSASAPSPLAFAASAASIFASSAVNLYAQNQCPLIVYHQSHPHAPAHREEQHDADCQQREDVQARRSAALKMQQQRHGPEHRKQACRDQLGAIAAVHAPMKLMFIARMSPARGAVVGAPRTESTTSPSMLVILGASDDSSDVRRERERETRVVSARRATREIRLSRACISQRPANRRAWPLAQRHGRCISARRERCTRGQNRCRPGRAHATEHCPRTADGGSLWSLSPCSRSSSSDGTRRARADGRGRAITMPRSPTCSTAWTRTAWPRWSPRRPSRSRSGRRGCPSVRIRRSTRASWTIGA